MTESLEKVTRERSQLLVALRSVLEASKEGASGEYIRSVIEHLWIKELVQRIGNEIMEGRS